jgi:hypothetical protein
VFDKITGYFDDIHKQIKSLMIENIRFYAGYGMELDLKIENNETLNIDLQTSLKKEYATLKK